MYYIYDTHVHTSETSGCSGISGEEVVSLYSAAGYDGICITDHYTREFFEGIKGSWRGKVKRYLLGYHNALEAAEGKGLNVILGVELRIYGYANDYLLFGVTEEFLMENPALYDMPLEELKPLFDEAGILIFQAHPFRNWMTRANPDLIHGVEVINAHPRHNSSNHLALEFAVTNGLLPLSGSDAHQVEDVGRGGLLLPVKPKDSREFAAAIRAREYRLIMAP